MQLKCSQNVFHGLVTAFILFTSCLVAVMPAHTNELVDKPTKEITLAVGVSIPPYINIETQQGVESQIIREAFGKEGYKVKLKFLSTQGIFNNFKALQVDAMLVSRSKDNLDGEVQSAFLSSAIINYHNYAISLKNANHQLANIKSLSQFRVIGFSSATKVLGDEFAEAIDKSKLYREVAEQTDQVIALYRNMVDVVIADPVIFSHFQYKLKEAFGEYHEVTMHDLFAPSPRHITFRNRIDRDSFNRGLNKIKANGRYQAILAFNSENFTYLINQRKL